VILHSRAAAQVSEYDNGGSHVTVYLMLGLVVVVGTAMTLAMIPVGRWGSPDFGPAMIAGRLAP
jgi:hypothetical protein